MYNIFTQTRTDQYSNSSSTSKPVEPCQLISFRYLPKKCPESYLLWKLWANSTSIATPCICSFNTFRTYDSLSVLLIFHLHNNFQGYLTCDSVKVRLAAVKCVCAMLTPFLKVRTFVFGFLHKLLAFIVVRVGQIGECQGSWDEGLHSIARGRVPAVPRVCRCHWSGFAILFQILTKKMSTFWDQ